MAVAALVACGCSRAAPRSADSASPAGGPAVVDSALRRADSPRATTDAIDSAIRARARSADERSTPPVPTRTRPAPPKTPAERSPPPVPSGTPRIDPRDAGDTVRGIAQVLGAARDAYVVVRPQGGRSVTIVGDAARAIGELSGTEIWARGKRDERGRLDVQRFQVRAVDGSPALDGTLVAQDGSLALITADGTRHSIGNPPAPLRAQVGERVWITGPVATGPIVYGIIAERR